MIIKGSLWIQASGAGLTNNFSPAGDAGGKKRLPGQRRGGIATTREEKVLPAWGLGVRRSKRSLGLSSPALRGQTRTGELRTRSEKETKDGCREEGELALIHREAGADLCKRNDKKLRERGDQKGKREKS